MQLKSIKLAGFKTFVEPNTMTIPARIVGLVGPNGCGKSNIIDAVRWVMGESAAGHLRGTSMEDVIFNGSSKRKPVNQASVELLFDNDEGRISGAWAEYRQISIRRTVDRGAGSTYYINGTKCRRRDVMDIFLGTGLGPRSYSIIEQGMISRVIEAKPEELRVFIEEAAGVSRYKERRRETETRIRHTEDNLNRLSDLMQEVQKQADRAERQAKTARRYKRIEQRLLSSRQCLYALTHADLQAAVRELVAQISAQDKTLLSLNHQLRQQESAHLTKKANDMVEQQKLETAQQQFYERKAEVGKLEQKIEFIQTAQRRADQEADQRASEIERLNEQAAKLRETLSEQQTTLATLSEQIQARTDQLEGLVEERDAAKAALREAEHAQQTKQQAQAQLDREQSLLTLQIQQQTRDQERAVMEQQKLKDESSALHQLLDSQDQQGEGESLAALEAAVETLASQLTVAEAQQADKRAEVDEARRVHTAATSELNTQQGKLEALRNLQQQALSAEDSKKTHQLPDHYQQAPRLTEMLAVAEGWEQAVEATLSDWLTARVISKFPDESDAHYLLHSDLGAVVDQARAPLDRSSQGRLSAQLSQAPQAVLAVAQHIHTSEDLPSALAQVVHLAAPESVVTKAGEWLFPMGIKPGSQAASLEQSLIYRQRIIAQLENSQATLHGQVREYADQLAAAQVALSEQDDELVELKRQSTEQQLLLSKRQAEHSAQLRQAEERQLRISAIAEAAAALDDAQAKAQSQIVELTEQLANYKSQMSLMATELTVLQQQKVAADVTFEEIDRQHHQHNRELQQQVIEQTKINGTMSAAEGRLQDISERIEQLQQQQTAALETDQQAEVVALTEDLQTSLAQQQLAESQLEAQRAESAQRQAALAEIEQGMTTLRESIQQEAERKNGLQIQAAEKNQQIDYQITRLAELGVTLRQAQAEIASRTEQLMASGQADSSGDTTQRQSDDSETDVAKLAAIAATETTLTMAQLNEEVEHYTRQLSQMGNINASAIEEFEELSERIIYLTEQHEDLTTALTTLREAIASIDEETKSRFSSTFEAVNEQVQRLFPKLFGGGKAHLELTDDDLLNAGVRIIARPPGKKPASIQLLSGGEKALTAAALVFGIFQLNPSPFCMLDEVDAPLDDANVGRFCELVKSLADRVQFIIVTHNKVTMEIADQLSGVTMGEPGVSRLVQVDIDDAVAMVA